MTSKQRSFMYKIEQQPHKFVHWLLKRAERNPVQGRRDMATITVLIRHGWIRVAVWPHAVAYLITASGALALDECRLAAQKYGKQMRWRSSR